MRNRIVSTLSAGSLVLFGALTGCDGADKDDHADHAGHADEQRTNGNRRGEPAGVDAEILAFLLAVDEHEVKAGSDADNEEIRPAVVDFAKMMQRDHGKHADDTKALADRLDIDPEDTPAVKALREKAEQKRSTLSPLDGDAFERAYVQAMIADHEEALAKIDAYLGATKREEIRAHLTTTREHVAHHLEVARGLQTGK